MREVLFLPHHTHAHAQRHTAEDELCGGLNFNCAPECQAVSARPPTYFFEGVSSHVLTLPPHSRQTWRREAGTYSLQPLVLLHRRVPKFTLSGGERASLLARRALAERKAHRHRRLRRGRRVQGAPCSAGLFHHSSAAIGGKLYVFGGHSTQGRRIASVVRWRPTTLSPTRGRKCRTYPRHGPRAFETTLRRLRSDVHAPCV